MLQNFEKFQPVKHPQQVRKQDAEGRFWSKFNSITSQKEYGSVTSVECSPIAPHDVLVAASTRLQIYHGRSLEVKKTISRFSDVVTSASYRKDGKLICAGDASGLVQVFDVTSRSILRSFRANDLKGNELKTKRDDAVRTVKFLCNNTQLVGAGDDKVVRLWDIASGSLVQSWSGQHSDYIRSCYTSQTNTNMFVTGSYDGTVKVFDVRTKYKSVMSLQHQAPVESVLMFPGDSILVAASGNSLYTWDLLAGGCQLQAPLSSHQKTVTCLAFNSQHTRILSGSLDQSVKVWDTSDWTVRHSYKYPSAVLAVALSHDDAHVAAGMVNSVLTIRKRVIPLALQSKVPSVENPFTIRPLSTKKMNRNDRDQQASGGTKQFFLRGQFRLPEQQELVVEHAHRKPKLRLFEKKLKSFEYKEALDSVLVLQASTVVELIRELQSRGDGLRIALMNRDELSLLPLLNFIQKNISNPRYTITLSELMNMIMKRYGDVLHCSEECMLVVRKIHVKTRHELQTLNDLQKLMGVLDMITNFSCAVN